MIKYWKDLELEIESDGRGHWIRIDKVDTTQHIYLEYKDLDELVKEIKELYNKK